MAIELILIMLNLVLVDGPAVYGGILPAMDAINSLKDKHGSGVTLEQVNSVLREYNVDVQKIAETYHFAG